MITCALAALTLTIPLAHAADIPSASPQPSAPTAVDHGDTAWMLVSTGLVMLMVPGLALFYGGMVRRKNVLATMMHSMVALGLDRRAVDAVRLFAGLRRPRTAASIGWRRRLPRPPRRRAR